MTSTRFDLLITSARLIDGGLVTIGINDGLITHVAPVEEGTTAPEEAANAASVIDAGGNLVTSSFVNGHMHLEKVYTLPMIGDASLEAYTTGAMGAAMHSISIASAVKKRYDESWIMPNVRRALDEALRHGVLHMLAFVDVDTTAGLIGMESVLAVREEYRDVIELQVVAFPQDGLLKDPGAAELCEEALRLGADVVGGIPWIERSDRDAQAHVDWACRLAAETGRRVAMLVDDAGDPTLRTTQMLAESMIEHGLEGRGVACHARAVGQYELPSVLRLAELARAAGLGFVTDPHTGPLHLPVREFLAEAVPVALGHDDIEDAYYPYGRHNMLEIAFLASHILQFLTDADQRRLLDMITGDAAGVLGIEGHTIAVGNPANLCVHGSSRIVDLLREHASPAQVIGKGRVVAETQTTTRLHAGPSAASKPAPAPR